MNVRMEGLIEAATQRNEEEQQGRLVPDSPEDNLLSLSAQHRG